MGPLFRLFRRGPEEERPSTSGREDEGRKLRSTSHSVDADGSTQHTITSRSLGSFITTEVVYHRISQSESTVDENEAPPRALGGHAAEYISQEPKKSSNTTLKTISYCFQRFVLALTTKGTSGMDKAIKAEELRLKRSLTIDEKMKILERQKGLEAEFDDVSKEGKALYKRLMDVDPSRFTDAAVYLDKCESDFLILFCDGLLEKEITSMPPLPDWIAKRLAVDPDDPAIKALKQHCLDAQAEKSALLLSNLKKDCLPKLEEMKTKLEATIVTAENKQKNINGPSEGLIADNAFGTLEELKTQRKPLNVAIEKLKGFDPPGSMESFLSAFDAITELSVNIGKLDSMLESEVEPIASKVGLFCEGLEKLGEHLVAKELKNSSKPLRDLFSDLPLIAGHEVRIPIRQQIALLNFLKKKPLKIQEFAVEINHLKELKNQMAHAIINGSPLHEIQEEIGKVNRKIVEIFSTEDNPDLQFPLIQFGLFIIGMTGESNTQVVTDTMSNAVVFARNGTSFLGATAPRAANLITNLPFRAEGLNPINAERGHKGYLYTEVYSTATKSAWKILPGIPLKLECSVSSALQQTDLSFETDRSMTFIFDYSEIFNATIPGGMPGDETLEGLFDMQESLRHLGNRISRTNLEKDPNKAIQQLKCVPQSLRSQISNDLQFWQAIDENVFSGQISPEIEQNFSRLIYPVAMLEAVLDLQGNISAGKLRSDTYPDFTAAGKDTNMILPPLDDFIVRGCIMDGNTLENLGTTESRFQLVMSPIVTMAKQIDTEIIKSFIFGSKPTIEQPLDFLCRLEGIFPFNEDKERFKKLVLDCFEKKISLSTPISEMSVEQLATLYNALMSVTDTGNDKLNKSCSKLIHEVSEAFDKQMEVALKKSDRQVRQAYQALKPYVHQCDVAFKIFNVLNDKEKEKLAGFPKAFKKWINEQGQIFSYEIERYVNKRFREVTFGADEAVVYGNREDDEDPGSEVQDLGDSVVQGPKNLSLQLDITSATPTVTKETPLGYLRQFIPHDKTNAQASVESFFRDCEGEKIKENMQLSEMSMDQLEKMYILADGLKLNMFNNLSPTFIKDKSLIDDAIKKEIDRRIVGSTPEVLKAFESVQEIIGNNYLDKLKLYKELTTNPFLLDWLGALRKESIKSSADLLSKISDAKTAFAKRPLKKPTQAKDMDVKGRYVEGEEGPEPKEPIPELPED